MMLTEFGLSLFFSDHAFAHSLDEIVSLWIVFMCFRQKVWCPLGVDQIHADLCKGRGFL